MKILKFILMMIASFIFINNTIGQVKEEIFVSCQIVDSISKKAVSYVTVTVLSNGKKVTLICDSIGNLNFSYDKNCLITLSAVGYHNKALSLTEKSVIKIIGLQPISQTLNEVVVNAPKPLVRQEIDRIIFNVQALQNILEISSFQLMNKVPLVSINLKGEIFVNGNRNIKILVNGRNNNLANIDPEGFLQSLNPINILNIEVITTPPAKYDAEGIYLININLKKNLELGYKGSFSPKIALPGLLGYSANIDSKQKKTNFTFFSSFNHQNLPSSLTKLNRLDKLNGSKLIQSGFNRNRYDSFLNGFDFNYELNKRNLFNVSTFISNSDIKNNSSFNSNFVSNSLLQSYEISTKGNKNRNNYNLAFNYQNEGLKDKNRILTLSYLFLKGNYAQLDFTSPFNQNNIINNYVAQEYDAITKEQAYQYDYQYPINENSSFELGSKLILRNNKSDSFNDFWTLPNQSDLQTNQDFLDHFQNIFSSYVSYSYKKDNWGLKTGIRLENSNFGATSNQNSFGNSFLNTLPSILLSYKNNKKNTFSFGFSKRVERPSIFQLNPFLNISNPQLFFSGNPNLTPVVYNSIEMTYSVFKETNYRFGLNYLSANNTISNIYIKNSQDLTLSTFVNTGNFKEIKFNVYFDKSFFDDLDISVNTRLSYINTIGEVDGINQINEGILFGFISNGAYFIGKTLSLNYYFNFSSPSINLQQNGAWFFDNSFGFSKSFLKRKITTSLNFQNPFTKYQYFRTTFNYNNIIQNSISNDYARQVFLRATYKFGKLKGQIKKPQKLIINDDLKGE
jgi:hypothetical protein